MVPISLPSYPDRDDIPYLEWFSPHFTSVFVALNPFLRVQGGPSIKDGHWLPDMVMRHAKRHAQECAVTWAEVATLCGFTSFSDVNQALRLTGSKRLIPDVASLKKTSILLEQCRKNQIYPPDEGCPSPPFECSLGAFATKLGHKSIFSSDWLGTNMAPLNVLQLSNSEQLNGCSQFAATDSSFGAIIYPDYHYWLIYQTSASLVQARPGDFFEGFFADASTNDLWAFQG